jgi:hypothetical protein
LLGFGIVSSASPGVCAGSGGPSLEATGLSYPVPLPRLHGLLDEVLCRRPAALFIDLLFTRVRSGEAAAFEQLAQRLEFDPDRPPEPFDCRNVAPVYIADELSQEGMEVARNSGVHPRLAGLGRIHARRPRAVLIEASDAFKAAATPQGDIVVSLRILDRLESESQLAAVLTHEAGHLQLNHFGRSECFDWQRKLISTGIGLAAIAPAAVGARRGGHARRRAAVRHERAVPALGDTLGGRQERRGGRAWRA